MADSESLTLLSYGTETEQYFVNRDGTRHYWLTHIRRDTRERVKVRLRKEDYYDLRDIMDKAIKDTLRANETRSDIYVRTAYDAAYRRKL